MTSRNIGFNVETRHTNEWFQTFNDVTALARRLSEGGQYVSVWASASDAEVDTDTQETTLPGEYFDENTLFKVHTALQKIIDIDAASDFYSGAKHKLVTDLINEMRNAGILFRERVK